MFTLLSPGEHSVNLLVADFPVPLLQDALQARRAFEGLKRYKAVHELSVDRKLYAQTIKKLTVLSAADGGMCEQDAKHGRTRPPGWGSGGGGPA